MKKRNVYCLYLVFLILSVSILSISINATVTDDLNQTNVTDNSSLNFTILPDTPLNVTINNSTNDTIITNVTMGTNDTIDTNVTTNDTNITLPPLINQTINQTNSSLNLTDINNQLNNTLNNLTTILENITTPADSTSTYNSTLDKATCYSIDNYDVYNITINGTVIEREINLSIVMCVNETTIYCNSETPTNMYYINLTDANCGGNGCQGKNVQKIDNYYDISNFNASAPNVFVCWAKKKQDGYTMWTYKTINLYPDPNNFYIFDFSNSTFLENNYNVTNTTVNNITTQVTNNITNNITTNMTLIYNITNNIDGGNITQNLTDIEDRLTVLEKWRVDVENTLGYIINMLNVINRILQDKLVTYDFSGSTFKSDNYNVTQSEVNNVTTNITNNIVNNITSEIDKVYNITNNVTVTEVPDNATITDVQNRLTLLEQWKVDAMNLINYLTNALDEIMHKLGI